MGEMIWHECVPLCPHIMGYFRNDVPPEEHRIMTAVCDECGEVTATPSRPQVDRPGFGMRAAGDGPPPILEVNP